MSDTPERATGVDAHSWKSTRWGIIAFGAGVGILSLMTPWGPVALFALLVVVVWRLCRRPPRAEAVVLAIAAAAITTTLLLFAATGLASVGLGTSRNGTAVVIDQG